MENKPNEIYNRAKKKVKAIKGFYMHLQVYIVINIALLIFKLTFLKDLGAEIQNPNFDEWLNWNIIGTPILWGIGLIIHGLYVHRDSFGFVKRWEQRKMKEFLEEDKYNN